VKENEWLLACDYWGGATFMSALQLELLQEVIPVAL
jgi:hypothetical protein